MFLNQALHRFLNTTALVLVSASNVAHADIDVLLPPGSEVAAIAACGGRVQRSGDMLRLTIAGSSSVELRDNINEDPKAWAHDRYELSGCADDLGLFVVWVHHYESTTQILVDPTNGGQVQVAGPIHLSPSKRAFVVVEPFSSGGEFWDFGINVFHRRPNGSWNRTWQYSPIDFQGREFLAWEGEGGVRISTATWRGGPLVTGYETLLRVSPVQFLREDGPEHILSDEKGRYVDHIPGEQ